MRRLGHCSQLLWLTTTTTTILQISSHSRSVSAFSTLPSAVHSFHPRSFSSTTPCQATNLLWETTWEKKHDYNATMIVGKKASVETWLPQLLESLELTEFTPRAVVKTMSEALDMQTGGSSSTLLATGSTSSKKNNHNIENKDDNNDESVHKLVVAGLPTKLSRFNHPMAVHSLTKVVASAAKGNHSRLVVLTDDFAIGPLAMAIAKAFPLFSYKNKKKGEGKDKNLHIIFVTSDGSIVQDPQQLHAAQMAAKGVQLAARLVDSYPELLTTTQFSEEVQQLVKQHPTVKMTEMIGTELATKGYGGLYGVGKAANCPPRMIILDYDGSSGQTTETETIALVGKGIVYDTGGLSLKVSNSIEAACYSWKLCLPLTFKFLSFIPHFLPLDQSWNVGYEARYGRCGWFARWILCRCRTGSVQKSHMHSLFGRKCHWTQFLSK